MIIPGILYVVLGILLQMFYQFSGKKERTVSRISEYFFCVGILVVAVHWIAFIVPSFKVPSLFITMILIGIFAVLILSEANKNYRDYRNRMDKILNGEDPFEKRPND